MPKFCVPIIYRGLDNFIVEASNKEEAKELASQAFLAGERPVSCGNEWENIETFGKIEEISDRPSMTTRRVALQDE